MKNQKIWRKFEKFALGVIPMGLSRRQSFMSLTNDILRSKIGLVIKKLLNVQNPRGVILAKIENAFVKSLYL